MAGYENELTAQIILELSNAGHFARRNHVGKVKDEHGRWHSFGLCKGASDIIGLTNAGQFIAIEVKSPKGKLSDEQVAFLRMVENKGGLAIIARNIDDVRNRIDGKQYHFNTASSE